MGVEKKCRHGVLLSVPCRQCLDRVAFRIVNFDCLEQVNSALQDLIAHMWVHDGYERNGYYKMTTEQKALYDSVIARRTEESSVDDGTNGFWETEEDYTSPTEQHFAVYDHNHKAINGILKDGHTMFAGDVVLDLNRKSHLEKEVLELRAELNKAVKSLDSAGFIDNGGELWKPPVSKNVGELHARLAICVEEFNGLLKIATGENQVDVYSDTEALQYLANRVEQFVSTLPAHAIHNAEILRCAELQAKRSNTCDIGYYKWLCCQTEEAVRAKNEAE